MVPSVTHMKRKQNENAQSTKSSLSYISVMFIVYSFGLTATTAHATIVMTPSIKYRHKKYYYYTFS